MRLKEALMLGIALHDRLRETIAEERMYLTGDDSGMLHDINERTAEIEMNIERNNTIVFRLFQQYYLTLPMSAVKTKQEIDGLFEALRIAMRGALKAVGETLMSVKQAKMEVLSDMRDLQSRKKAISSYAYSRF